MPKNRTPEEQLARLIKKQERKAKRKAAAEEKKAAKKDDSAARSGRSNVFSLRFTDEELAQPKAPSYLRGMEIGAWHAQKNAQKNKLKSKKKMDKAELRAEQRAERRAEKLEQKMMVTLPLELPPEKEEQIKKMLTKISAKAPPSVESIRTGSSSTLESARVKYQHIPESTFKDNFLSLICGNINDKINKGVRKCKLNNNEALNKTFKATEEAKMNSTRFRNMLHFRKKLPALNKREEIINMLKEYNVILISGETGCGKTTQVPQFILNEEIMNGRGSTCHIVCTQPRRISAISMAERVAEERDERLGDSVGFQIRLERSRPRDTGSILFCTTGVLLQIMNTDPFLTRVSHIILDEIHERDTISDFVICFLKDIVPSRPDLKVILMSATLNAEQFSKYFNNCPGVHIPGFTYNVKEMYLEDVYQLLRYPALPPSRVKVSAERKRMSAEEVKKEESIDQYIDELEKNKKYSASVIENLRNTRSKELDIVLICDLIRHISVNEPAGAILVFLPGWDKISALNKCMNESSSFPASQFLILPVHSMMPTVSQKEIFNKPPSGVRKIVLATNIAETSITIDDIIYVIDCGKIKIKMFELDHNISTLREHWISLANAKQRRGRAGRVQEGICYHLYTKGREETFDPYQLPEMMRIRLEEVILQAKVLQVGKIGQFLQKVIDPPDPRTVEISIELLKAMNAVDDDEQLTPLGYHLAKLPLDPQAGKMLLLAAMFGCLDPIASIAGSISYKDPFACPLGMEKYLDQSKKELDFGRKSDHLLIAHVLTQWDVAVKKKTTREFIKEYYVSSNIVEQIKEMKGQFAQHLFHMNFLVNNNVKNDLANINSNNLGLIKAVICGGLYPNVAIVKNEGKSKRVKIHTVEDGNIAIHPKSVNAGITNFESNFLVYYMKLKSNGILIHDSTLIYPLALIFFCHNLTLQNGGKKRKVIVVNKCIQFECKSSTALLIQELRAWLDWLFELKVSHPGISNWDPNSDEYLILSAIIELISTEYQQYYSYDDNEDDSETDSD